MLQGSGGMESRAHISGLVLERSLSETSEKEKDLDESSRKES